MSGARDIFLHFLNRDSRQIYGLFQLSERDHFYALCRTLNISALLCANKCYAPPGFSVECELAYRALRKKKEYLADGLVQLPMREANIGDFVEKKRREYAPVRDRYEGIFSDTMIEELGRFSDAIVRRTSEVGEAIARDWERGPDTSSRPWRAVLPLLPRIAVDRIRAIPKQIREEGSAVTWPSIEQLLPSEALPIGRGMRRILQNSYFRQYLREYGLVALVNIPAMPDHFDLPTLRKIYDYRRFSGVLSSLDLKVFLEEAAANQVLELRRQPGYFEFLFAYRSLAEHFDDNASLAYLFAEAAKRAHFDWAKYVAVTLKAPTDSGFSSNRIVELGDALRAVAREVTRIELPEPRKQRTAKRQGADGFRFSLERFPMADVVIFLALEEELGVLCDRWHLERNFSRPAASGAIGKQRIDVLCPREMGRVAAAVEVTACLEARRTDLPKLLIVAGLAGGFESEGASLGSVLIPTTVVDLATRKIQDDETGTTTEFRRHDFHPHGALWRLLMSDHFKRDDWERQAIREAEWPEGLRPSLKDGPIASVDEVISSTEWQRQLTDACPKLLGVEMESGGVCAAAQRYAVPVVILRTVSDAADPAKKDTAWRRRGMKTVAILLEMLDIASLISTIGTRGA